MLNRDGDLILNRKGNPIAIVDECENCILIHRAHWNDRGIRTRVSELAGGVKRHLKMPYDVYAQLSKKIADSQEE